MNAKGSSSDDLILRDNPGCFWLFGLFFIAIGGLGIAVGLGLLSPDAPQPWEQLLSLVFGGAAVGAGIYEIVLAPLSTVTASRQTHIITIRQRGLLGGSREEYPAEGVADVTLAETDDIDGGPVYSIRLRLADGGEVPVTRLWLHDRPRLEENIRLLKEFQQNCDDPD